jgi:hypothetical protein
VNVLSSPSHLIIIGAQRAGSTWLYELLDKHPDVYMQRPQKPEPKFFLDPEWSQRDYNQQLFKNAPSDVKYWGEKSVSYYQLPEVARRIDSCLREVKILVILRNPVGRAISNFRFSSQSGLETRTIEEVFIQGAEPPSLDVRVSVNPFEYLSRGHYAEHLRAYFHKFSGRIHIIILEEALSTSVHKELWKFLNIPPISTSFARVNASIESQVPEEVNDILMSYYESHIGAIENVIGRNLDIWRQN